MCRIMEDGIQRDPAAGALLGQRFTRVRVDINAGKKLLLEISSRILFCTRSKDREVGYSSNREFHGLSGDQRLGAFQRFARERILSPTLRSTPEGIVGAGWI